MTDSISARSDESIASLVQLMQHGDYAGVIAHWEGLPALVAEVEIASRIAAAASARLGRLDEAGAILEGTLARNARADAATLALAGRVAFDLRRYDLSIDRLQRALDQRADPLWWLWLADAAIKATTPQHALTRAAPFASLRLSHPEFAIMYATLLAHAGQADAARAAFEDILLRWPRHEVAGPGYAEFVMREYPLQAEQLLARHAWQPAWDTLSPARVRALLWLPAFYESEESAARWRSRLLANLQALTEAARRSPLKGDERAACIATTPFFVAFHDADVTAIQFAWGDFVEAVVAPLRDELGLPRSRKSGAQMPARTIGVVSNRITNSSAGRFFNGWIDELSAAGFDVRLYVFGNTDAVTDHYASRHAMKRFPMDDSEHWRVAAEALRDDRNDVLLFPEPQGSQLITLLAGLRLAPVQCAAFGNPITTGLQTMDYFLSPDAAEVAQPDAYYRERVIRLAGMGTRVTADLPAELGRFDRSELGLGERHTVYLVSQQLQKWSPSFVELLGRVLAEDAQGHLLYFSIGGTVSVGAFQPYLARLLGEHGVDAAKRTSRLPTVTRARFLAINAGADVAIDTLSFGGGSTTFDAISVGLPVVSLRGRFLRSRQTGGMLDLTGQGHLAAADTGELRKLAHEVAGNRRVTRSDHHLQFPVPAAGDAVFTNAAEFFRSLGRS